MSSLALAAHQADRLSAKKVQDKQQQSWSALDMVMLPCIFNPMTPKSVLTETGVLECGETAVITKHSI